LIRWIPGQDESCSHSEIGELVSGLVDEFTPMSEEEDVPVLRAPDDLCRDDGLA
jgi:hypothetical protein